MRKKILKRLPKVYIVVIGFISLLFFGTPLQVLAQTYAEPTSPPPAGILPSRDSNFEYLLGSTATQQKTGSLILGQKIRRIAVYSCDGDEEKIWQTLIQSDVYLHRLATYYDDSNGSAGGCDDVSGTGANLSQLFSDHAANPFQLIIVQDPHIRDATRIQQLYDAVTSGATLFGSGEVVDITSSRQLLFAGVILCQSQCDDLPNTGCAFLGQTTGGGSCTPQGGTANVFDHGLWKLLPGDALQKPVQNRFEGIMADSVERGGSVNPTLDVPYANPGTQGAIGEVAHWKYGKGQVYYIADEARNVYPADSDCSSDINCINNSVAATTDFYLQTWRNIIDACHGDCASLCLNATVGLSAIADNSWLNDSTNCIHSWVDIQGKLSLNYARLLTSGQAASGQVDRGFSVLKSTANQKISLIVETPTGGPGAFQAISTGTFQFAGKINGPVVIEKRESLAEFCLNGTCITDWSQAIPTSKFPESGLRLQSSHMVSRLKANLRLQGPLIGESIILGSPSVTTPIAVTCGDRLCSFENGETATTCPADC